MKRSRTRLGLAAVTAAVLASLMSPLGQSASVADDESGPLTVRPISERGYSTPAGAIFSRPGNGNIHDRVIRNIRNTPGGAYIRGVTWTFSSGELASELLAARRDGAVVRILISRQDRNERPVNRLQSALGDNCGPGRSCIKVINFSARGTDQFDNVYTTLHQKSWTFSTTGADKRVTMISSHNATDGARDYQYNAGYQFVNNDDVYNAMVAKFVEQTDDSPAANPWDVVKISKTVSLFFGPWNSPGMADPVVNRIQLLPDDDLVVRIANSGWTGERGANIARALAAKARGGAKIYVLASRPFGAGVRDILAGAGIPIRNGFFGDENYHHLKFMTAKWGSGAGTKTRVWTGSENWSEDARGSDELMVRVGAGSTHSQFVGFFDSIYN